MMNGRELLITNNKDNPNGDHILARIRLPEVGCLYAQREDKPEEANGRLMAAAPELLEALEDLLGDRPSVQGGLCQHCGRDYIGDFLEGDCSSDDCPSFKARAAIAKAEGGAA